MRTSRDIKKIRKGVIIGGFYVPSPWNEEEPLLIKKAIVRRFDDELWAEHIEPQYDYTEVDESYSKYILTSKK